MNTLEEKMRLKRKIFEDEKQSRDVRVKAFEEYRKLHSKRSKKVVHEMEKVAGLI